MTALIESVSTLAQPWADIYADSTLVSTTVEFLHLAGLLVAGGFALAFDRATLRVMGGAVSDRSGFLRELSAVHLPVLIGLFIVVASGLALMLSDVDIYLPSRVFWLKMGLFGLLLINGLVITRTGARLRRDAMDAHGWLRLRRASVRSMGLWTAVLFLGVYLTVAA